jgi:1-acyl-sn-glycerol-3-phosphate acyltransferase
MVNQKFLDSINLVTSPWGQKFMARAVLGPNYHLFARVKIEMENMDNIPKGEPVIFAMNHTDRFNYWPFQYKLWSTKDYPFTTVWVKGTYFNNKILGQFLKVCNTFPVPSKGYLIRELFKQRCPSQRNPGGQGAFIGKLGPDVTRRGFIPAVY